VFHDCTDLVYGNYTSTEGGKSNGKDRNERPSKSTGKGTPTQGKERAKERRERARGMQSCHNSFTPRGEGGMRLGVGGREMKRESHKGPIPLTAHRTWGGNGGQRTKLFIGKGSRKKKFQEAPGGTNHEARTGNILEHPNA